MFNTCPFKIDESRKLLILDMANGICRQTAGGGPVDLGNVTAWLNPSNGAQVSLGNMDYTEFCFNLYSHIVEIPLSDAQMQLALTSPLHEIPKISCLRFFLGFSFL